VPLVTNPKYEVALSRIVGDNYEKYFNEGDPYSYYNNINGLTGGNLNSMAAFNQGTGQWFATRNFDAQEYRDFVKKMNDFTDKFFTDNSDIGGVTGSWASLLGNPPELDSSIGEKPQPPAMPPEPVLSLPAEPPPKENPLNGQCINIYTSSKQRCYMHVLSDLLYDYTAPNAMNDGNQQTFTTTNGNTFEIVHGGNWNWNSAKHDSEKERWTEAREAILLEDAANGTNLFQRIIDFLYEYRGRYVLGSSTGGIADSDEQVIFDVLYKEVGEAYSKHNPANNEEHDAWEAECTRLQEQYQRDVIAHQQECRRLTDKYNADLAAWTAAWETLYASFENWLNQCQELKDKDYEMIKNLPDKEIPDEKDPKVQWYTNLWYRMGGISETLKEIPSTKFDVLDDNKMSNPDYLQYALETGTLAMEQVVFSEKGSGLYPGLKTTDWKASTYKNASDISEQDDSLKVTKAEVKYKKAVEEIQVKDKRYDLDLKKLDTQHNALQTEYDSLKTVINKNTERSFKAFS
jgi:hypothetical protein